ncbi:Hypothetical predicted protein, partial [Podarcis lilfordi]
WKTFLEQRCILLGHIGEAVKGSKKGPCSRPESKMEVCRGDDRLPGVLLQTFCYSLLWLSQFSRGSGSRCERTEKGNEGNQDIESMSYED